MEHKYILDWVPSIEDGKVCGWKADTKIGHYTARDSDLGCFWEFRQLGCSVTTKYVKSGTARMSAEKDYFERCTEKIKPAILENAPRHVFNFYLAAVSLVLLMFTFDYDVPVTSTALVVSFLATSAPLMVAWSGVKDVPWLSRTFTIISLICLIAGMYLFFFYGIPVVTD